MAIDDLMNAGFAAYEAGDANLAKTCWAKQKSGEKLSRDERRELTRILKAQEQRRRKALYQSVPKGDYVSLSGLSYKRLADQASRLGLPLQGRTIDLGKALRAIHGCLAAIESARPESRPNTADQRYREAKAALAELELRRRKGELLPIEDIRDVLARWAELFRRLGERLQSRFGDEAAEMMTDTIDHAKDLLDREFTPGDDGK